MAQLNFGLMICIHNEGSAEPKYLKKFKKQHISLYSNKKLITLIHNKLLFMPTFQQNSLQYTNGSVFILRKNNLNTNKYNCISYSIPKLRLRLSLILNKQQNLIQRLYIPFNSQGHIGTGPHHCHLWESNPFLLVLIYTCLPR